jgi:hypothetical protein
VEFDWNEKKRESNVKKHGIDFLDAQKAFDNHHLTVQDTRFDYPEERFLTLGIISGVVIFIAHTENEFLIKIISARKATKNEQKIYFQSL